MTPDVAGIPDGVGELVFVSPYLNEAGQPIRVMRQLPGGKYYRIIYDDGYCFVVNSDLNEMWITWPPEFTVHDTAVHLLGPVFGMLMRMRRIVCLHASAVEIEGVAVAFVGDSGAGKSSTAAAFAHQGYRVLSDDVVTLRPQRAEYIVERAYSHLRLLPKTVKALYGSEDALPLVVGTWDKRVLDLSARGVFASSACPVRAIYWLGPRVAAPEAPHTEEIAPREAFLVLVGNSYGTDLLDESLRREEFEFFTELLRRVPVRKLRSPAELDRLPELCDVVAADLKRIISPQRTPAT